MFIPCSSCYSRTLVSQKRLASDPELLETINAGLAQKVTGRMKIRSILELLVPRAQSGIIGERTIKKLEGLKPACYYGCLTTRFPCDMEVPDDVENPQGMEIVCSALGAKPLDWGYKTDCCGAAASVNDAAMSLSLTAKIMKDAAARGANCFVTTCPMCQFNLDVYQDEIREKFGISERLPVYFITELVGIAMGISPHEMQIDRHFTEATGLLKELQLI